MLINDLIDMNLIEVQQFEISVGVRLIFGCSLDDASTFRPMAQAKGLTFRAHM